ncbi:MAG: sugar ABC transporter ATP-binding protein [bacterium]
MALISTDDQGNGKILLEMCNITKTFPGVTALEDINFELKSGEIHVLLGENGAGKSTLVKILSGAHPKNAGIIRLNGDEVEIRNPRHAQELGIGVIYQELNLVPHLTVAENIFLGREPTLKFGVIDKRKMLEDAGAILRELDVDLDSDSRIFDLGLAQQQMVEVAKALSLDARILIMDEPTSALTTHEIGELFQAITRLKMKGVGIIYISHRMEELFEIGDRVTVLRDGKLVGTRNLDQVNRPTLIRMMVNREVNEQFPVSETRKGEEILRVEHLNRGETLKDISFTVHRGEILGIAGLLGSGRTELARAVFGVDRIDSGKVYLKGRLQTHLSPRNSINHGLGFLTEDRKLHGLVLDLSVRDNICLPSIERLSKFGVVSNSRETSMAVRYIDELKIKTPSIHQKTLYLSGGNQQKVVISKWLCCDSEIFLFDEPTRGVDVGSKMEIYKLIRELASRGVAVVMISSELPEILGMSDRILVMGNGRIRGHFEAQKTSPEQILNCALGA